MDNDIRMQVQMTQVDEAVRQCKQGLSRQAVKGFEEFLSGVRVATPFEALVAELRGEQGSEEEPAYNGAEEENQ